MLTLTSRDKAYVRAVAHGGLHDMRGGIYGAEATGAQCYLASTHDRYHLYGLMGGKPKTQIAKSWHTGNNNELQDLDHDLTAAVKNWNSLSAFTFAKAADLSSSTKLFDKRYGDNVFLDSSSLSIRISMPLGRYNSDEQSHCRFLIFRARDKQSNVAETSHDHANPHYDLFLNQYGTELGLNGYVDHQDSENYIKDSTHRNLSAHHIHSLLVNKKKYVVMKDCKFNLGRDFGSIAMQTKVRWDWNDQMLDIPSDRDDVTQAQDGPNIDKNYSWYFLLIATNPYGGTATQTLTTEIIGTTAAKTMD